VRLLGGPLALAHDQQVIRNAADSYRDEVNVPFEREPLPYFMFWHARPRPRPALNER